MKLATAVALALGGASLILAVISERTRWLQVALALLMAAAGAAFMAEAALNIDFGIDNLSMPGVDATHLGRPPVAAARGMIMTGLALALLPARSGLAGWVRLALALVGLVGALVTMLGALMTPVDSSLHVQLFPVAAQAPIGFACLYVGVLAAGSHRTRMRGFLRFSGPIAAFVALLTTVSLSLVSIEVQEKARVQGRQANELEMAWRACSICCRTPRPGSAAFS